MSHVSSRNDSSFSDKLFLFSVVLGPAASYSVLYLFHIVVATKFSRSAFLLFFGKSLSLPKSIKWDAAFFAVFLGWYVLSILWAENTAYALKYCSYVLFAALTVFYTMKICETLPRLQEAFRFLSVLFCVQIFLALLEGARIIRLPFSTFSPYQVYFGRQPPAGRQYLNQESLDYFSAAPTGFFGNPNNLAAFLVFILPFFVLHRKWKVKLAGTLSIFYIGYMAGARAALISYLAVVFLAIVFYGSNLVRTLAISTVLIVVSLGAGLVDVMQYSTNPRIAEIGTLGTAVRDMVVELASEDQGDSEESVGVRVQLILNGVNALRASYGLGVGAGGSQTVQEQAIGGNVGDVTSMHNFWIELLVEGGIVFAGFFVVWFLSLIWRLRLVGQRATDELLKYGADALLLGFIGFIPGAIGPSSVIYMLPMWMMAGVALAVIQLEARLRTRTTADATGALLSTRWRPASPLSQGLKAGT